MTEHEVDLAERVLRAVLADQARTVRPPADAFAGVARRHRRGRRRAVAAVALTVAVIAVGVPAGLSSLDSSSATGTTNSSATSGPSHQVTTVRGSLAGDTALLSRARALVLSDLRTPWPRVNHGSAGAGADRGTAGAEVDRDTIEVVLAEQFEGDRIVLVRGERRSDQAYETWLVTAVAGSSKLTVTGRSMLAKVTASDAVHGRDPSGLMRLLTNVYPGDRDPANPGILRRIGVAVFPPGSTARMTHRQALSDSCTAGSTQDSVPMKDGVALFSYLDADLLQVTDATTRKVFRLEPPSGTLIPPGAASAVASAADARWAAIKGTIRGGVTAGDRGLLDLSVSFLADSSGVAEKPLPSAYLGVWIGRPTGGGPAVVLAGVRYASGAVLLQGISRQASGQGAVGWLTGCLPAGQLGHRIIAGRLDTGLGALVVVAPTGATRAEAVFANGTVVPVPLTDGGGILDRPGAVRTVRAYDARGNLLDQRALGGVMGLPVRTGR